MSTAGVLGLNVVTGWQQRRSEWVDVAWLAMRVHVGRLRKLGVDVIDVEGEEEFPPRPLAPEAESSAPPPPHARGHGCPPPPPPPEGPAFGHPGRAGGRGVGGAAASAAAGGGVGGARDERGGRQPRRRGPPV